MDPIRTTWLESLRTHHPLGVSIMFNPEKILKGIVHDAQDKQNTQFDLLISKLDTIISLLQKEITYMATLQDITDAVNNETSVDNAIVTLLDGIVTQLQAAQSSTDPTAMATVVANIQANTKILSDAIVANTPVTASQASATSTPAPNSTPTPAPTVTNVTVSPAQVAASLPRNAPTPVVIPATKSGS